MTIDIYGFLLILTLTVLRLGIPLLAMIALCKFIPWCFPEPTETVKN